MSTKHSAHEIYGSHSWPGPPVGANRISGSERQLCERSEHLRLRQDIGSASLCQSTLSRSYVQQISNTVVVRFEGGAVGLTAEAWSSASAAWRCRKAVFRFEYAAQTSSAI